MSTPQRPSITDLVAMHEPARRRIVDLLAARGPSQVGTLARELDAQVGSISHHLRMLERAGVVERAPELATDGRTSWWRLVERTWAWSPEDFDGPAEHHQAVTAQGLNTRHQAELLRSWRSRAAEAGPAWREAAFSTDLTTRATAAELADLAQRLDATVDEWLASFDRDDDQEREPVFVFAHGFPFQP